MTITKHLIFAFIFFWTLDNFAQSQTDTSEFIETEQTDHKTTEQFAVRDSGYARAVRIPESNKLIISENNAAPSIQYKPIISTVVGIVVLDIRPSNTGGEPTRYTVSPALPRGLFLNPSTGVICGIPMEIKQDDIYTITAVNHSGKSSFGTMLFVSPPIEKENEIFIQMSQYPDSLEDFLRIDGERGIDRVEVHNARRQLVYYEEYNNSDPLSRKLVDLSKLERGEYLLTLFKGIAISSFTIINEKPSYTIFKS